MENRNIRDSQRIDVLVDPAVKAVLDVFEGHVEPEDLSKAQLAKSILATWAKLKQTERAQDMMYFTMARELSQDKEQLRQYMELTLPGGGPTKMLPSESND